MINKNSINKDFHELVFNKLNASGYTILPMEYEDVAGAEVTYPFILYDTNTNYDSNTLKYAGLASGDIDLIVHSDDHAQCLLISDTIINLIDDDPDYEIIGIKIDNGTINESRKQIYFSKIIINVRIDGIR